MKLYWLKRLALKWLVNDHEFYDIMSSLRGPDIQIDVLRPAIHIPEIKKETTSRIRFKVGMIENGHATIDKGEPDLSRLFEAVQNKMGDWHQWIHFSAHIECAVKSLKVAGYK